MAAHWNKDLIRPVKYRTVTLSTLRDAADFLMIAFPSTWILGLRRCVKMLMRAAETGEAADIAAATDLLASVLSRIATIEGPAVDRRPAA